MSGDFELLYDKADGARVRLAAWTLALEPDQWSAPLPTPQLPADAAPGAPCWLVFRGQLGFESGAVVGTQAGCPPGPPPPPQHGEWVVYLCSYGAYGSTTSIRYNYATDDPPLWDDGLPALSFFLLPATGETNCSLVAQALPSQPPGTVTVYPF